MTILACKLDTRNDLLTSRAGLLSIAQLMDSLSLAERIDQHFPQPKSNPGYRPSEFIKTLILMQHEGSFHLDDIRHLQDDEALRRVLALKKLPQATTLGDWLRRTGKLLPEELVQHRAVTLRWRLYAMAAKVVKTGRQLFVKRQGKQRILLYITNSKL